MSTRTKKLLAAAGVVALLAAGLVAALVLKLRDRPEGALDTELKGVTVVHPKAPPVKKKPKPKRKRYRYLRHDKLCWPNFGRDAQRTLASTHVDLGRPTHLFWGRGLHSYIEYPASYCGGAVYVNTYRGGTWALNAHNGEVLWKRSGGHKPSTPAIDGPRLIVSSTDGTVTAFRRSDGRPLWRFRVRAKVESSPVVVGRFVYFGATDGRLFALYSRSGRVRWAFNTRGRINASPSVYRGRVCINTYAGSIFCLRARSGRKLWSRYFKRDPFRYESFYASPSTDGRRLFTLARSGRMLAVLARSGHKLWQHRLSTLGYATPAVAYGRVFVGDFNGILHCYRAADGRELWRRHVPGRILGAAVVIGKLVFFSTLERRTYAARVADGRIVWRLGIGKYSPVIASERHYFFTLNGRVMAFWGKYSLRRAKAAEKRAVEKKRAAEKKRKRRSHQGRVA